ncbi:SDR family oxidoreductase [Antrihabitans sp. YC2-6]|uniref:SDR family oxidoreductase n=1 Tax=Antrihabitans sp. YC2-6 TaxID=2799498 RepID=UPI0018F710A7|nr:SDR family oxidoreductase [Antrihabitans sp. YC2-6]MBJ8348309.1 SDR family oxidoreductase [Antrihabitans sp. YC2-6]
MILVIGATGKIGGEVARLLTDSGKPLRALVRTPSKAGALTDLGVELAAGDLADSGSLDRAMQGVDRLFLVSVQDLRQAELQGNAVDAAVRNGVGHIVKVSGIAASISPGGPAEIGRQHWHTEHRIEETGVPFTFLRPGFFMQNLLATAAPMVARVGLLAAPMDGALIAMVDARDIAAAAAAVLTDDTHHDRVYDITGPRAFDYAQLAAVLADATEQHVRYVGTPPIMAAKVIRRQGHPDWYIQHLAEMAEMFRAGAGATVSSAVEDLTGRPPRSIESFAHEYAAMFRQGRAAPLVHTVARAGIGIASRAATFVRA